MGSLQWLVEKRHHSDLLGNMNCGNVCCSAKLHLQISKLDNFQKQDARLTKTSILKINPSYPSSSNLPVANLHRPMQSRSAGRRLRKMNLTPSAIYFYTCVAIWKTVERGRWTLSKPPFDGPPAHIPKENKKKKLMQAQTTLQRHDVHSVFCFGVWYSQGAAHNNVSASSLSQPAASHVCVMCGGKGAVTVVSVVAPAACKGTAVSCHARSLFRTEPWR